MYFFGSDTRDESNDIRDIDFLIEMDGNASAYGVGVFQCELQQLLGIGINAMLPFVFP